MKTCVDYLSVVELVSIAKLFNDLIVHFLVGHVHIIFCKNPQQ